MEVTLKIDNPNELEQQLFEFLKQQKKELEEVTIEALTNFLGVYDSIIASTCMIYDLPLWTYNKKDFRFLDIELR